jgi:lipoyl(octanoyl) transferase
MALDEALLEAVARLGRPVLRFYGWTEPAASFGYFQKHADVEALTPLRPLVRRPTGGGIVPHDADWTYSAAFPPGHEWYELAAIESYRRVHEWIQAAFTRLTVPTEVALAALRAGPGQCFAGHEQFDLLWRGRKIAGAAQRRRRDGLLIQGSVQPPRLSPPLARSDWEAAMLDTARHRDASPVAWETLPLETALSARTRELVETKYLKAEYNQRR